jgi:hypothetical protein
MFPPHSPERAAIARSSPDSRCAIVRHLSFEGKSWQCRTVVETYVSGVAKKLSQIKGQVRGRAAFGQFLVQCKIRLDFVVHCNILAPMRAVELRKFRANPKSSGHAAWTERDDDQELR